MIEAGEVGAVFTIVDEASAVLKLIADQFERLDAVIKSTKEQAGFGRIPSLTAVSRQLTNLDEIQLGSSQPQDRSGYKTQAAAAGDDTAEPWIRV
jgi:hypothetical protein